MLPCSHVAQPDVFYDFCDENGLLIWQDAMFGGSHYPRTAEWLTNYADEITQQVRQGSPGLGALSGSSDHEPYHGP